MMSRGPVGTSLRIARVSTPELTNASTALTSLVAVPLLEVLLIVAVSASLGGDDLVRTAYAAIILAYGLSIVTGTVGQVTRDRQIGVLQEALMSRFFYLPYWLGKVTVPAVLGAAVAVASSLAVLLVDPDRSAQAFVGAVALLPVVTVGASLAAVGVATLSVGASDPYLVANVAQGVLPLTAGVVVPLSSYPAVLAHAASALPFTAAVEAMRVLQNGGDTALVATLMTRELLVCSVWFVIGAVVSRRVVRALRDGRRREEIW